MIEAEIYCNDELLMKRVYAEPNLSLEVVGRRLVEYIQEERLNEAGECKLRVRFQKAAARGAAQKAAS